LVHKPSKPSLALVSSYVRKWKRLEKSRVHNDALTFLFRGSWARNDSIRQVLIKVSALNDFYKTGILDTFSVAKHIVNKKIDGRLQVGDIGLVDVVKRVIHNGKVIEHYSFATKYCGLHQPDQYPMWDSYVDKMLHAYRKRPEFHFEDGELESYPRFVKIVNDFQSYYSLGGFSLRELDVFLWLYGKKCFPRKN
jgi:hypothetical protein